MGKQRILGGVLAAIIMMSISVLVSGCAKFDVLDGAPYANIMAPELKAYAEKLSPEKVGRVVLFTTSNWSRRAVYALRKLLSQNGVKVDDKHFYAHMLHISGRIDAAREFGKEYADK